MINASVNQLPTRQSCRPVSYLAHHIANEGSGLLTERSRRNGAGFACLVSNVSLSEGVNIDLRYLLIYEMKFGGLSSHFPYTFL